MNAAESIMKHEGFREKMYKDSVGVPTIGFGFNLEQISLPRPVAELWLAFEIEKHQQELKKFHWYNALDPVRQDVLLDMHFNLGDNRFRGFKKMIKALENQKYGEAAKEMLDSKWAAQVGDRAKTLSEKMANA